MLRIKAVAPGSQGESLGLQAGDLILSYDGKETSSNLKLSNAQHFAKSKGREKVAIEIERSGRAKTYYTIPGALGIECSEDKKERITDKLAGIGGLLILPAMGLILAIIIGVISFFSAFSIYSDAARTGYGVVLALGIIVDLGLLVFTVYASIQFFREKRNAPNVMIALMLVYLVASCGYAYDLVRGRTANQTT